jgi:HEAT repeat protein
LHAPASASAFDEVIDSPMYRLPELPMAAVEWVFPPELTGLWLRALERPEAEMRLNAALAIALAHRRGMKGLETTIGPLTRAMDAPNEKPAVRAAVACTLIALNGQESASILLARAQAGGVELREVIEPALARWDYQPARAVWLARLTDTTPEPRSLTLAIQNLGAVREEQAVEPLRRLATTPNTPGPIRMAAARALGQISTGHLEPDAEALAADGTRRGMGQRLAAAQLMRRHGSQAAVGLLQRLARDPEPTVAVIAADRLLEIDPTLVLPMLNYLINHDDPQMRTVAIEAIHRVPSKERLVLLADRLKDAHPDARRKARQRLHQVALNQAHRQQVLGEATRVLAEDDWRGQEQAAILLAMLQHRPAATRFVELLTADRPEVFMTVAWGLRRLAVPESLPQVLNYVRQEYARVVAKTPLPSRAAVSEELISHQLSQLNQLLGQQKYKPAEPVLRTFVPKRTGVAECRAAAIWALGLLHEDTLVADLAVELHGRLKDAAGVPAEEPQVIYMSAITVGRMQADEALPTLRVFAPPGQVAVTGPSRACAWAICRITGEIAPRAAPLQRVHSDWFLFPQRSDRRE